MKKNDGWHEKRQPKCTMPMLLCQINLSSDLAKVSKRTYLSLLFSYRLVPVLHDLKTSYVKWFNLKLIENKRKLFSVVRFGSTMHVKTGKHSFFLFLFSWGKIENRKCVFHKIDEISLRSPCFEKQIQLFCCKQTDRLYLLFYFYVIFYYSILKHIYFL